MPSTLTKLARIFLELGAGDLSGGPALGARTLALEGERPRSGESTTAESPVSLFSNMARRSRTPLLDERCWEDMTVRKARQALWATESRQ